MMCKKESIVIILVSVLMLLTVVAKSPAEEGVDPNTPAIADPNTSVTDDPNDTAVPEPIQSATVNSNDLALEDDDVEIFDPNWADGFNVENVKLVLNFQDALISDVLDYLSKEAGLIIISDTLATGRVNLISKRPLGIDEVIALISSVLNKEGYTAIRTGRTLKIISLAVAPNSNLPVITTDKLEDMVEGDDVVTCTIPIRYVDAIRLREDLTPLLSSYAVVTSNQASNSLIITDTTANIKRLLRIIKSVDTQWSTVADVKVFLLEYADADSTAELINEVFRQQVGSSSSSGSRSQSPFLQMMQGRSGDRGSDRDRDRNQQSSGTGVVQNIPVIAAADDRTNAVVVSGPADMLVIVEEVVKELDNNPNEEHQLFLYKLKYATAENIADRLNNLFQELENINQQNLRNSGGGGRGGGGSSSSSSSSGSVTDEVYIEADEDTNSLIIMTSTKNYDKIEGIIKMLDIPIPQVLIKVLLAELTTSNATDIGVDWTVESTNSDGDLVSNMFNYSPKATEGLTTHLIQGDLDITLRALQETGKLNVLSRPYITTSNNQPATINVGQRYPFITDSQITDQGNINNTVAYEDIGIILEVTPTINADGLVIMDVNPEITTALTDTVRISDQVDATIFATRSAQCRVSVPNGQTVVVGGLMQDTDSENVEKIPLMGDLPLLGGLFKRTVTDKEKTELLIFLTPQVAEDVNDLERISDYERSKSKFLNEMEGTSLQEQVENMESVYQGTTDQENPQ